MLRNPVSSASHAMMAVAALVVTVFFLRLTRHEPRARFLLGVFGFSMILLYSASGAYHGVTLSEETIAIFQKIDLSAIYILIAGTYTPVIGMLIGGAKHPTNVSAETPPAREEELHGEPKPRVARSMRSMRPSSPRFAFWLMIYMWSVAIAGVTFVWIFGRPNETLTFGLYALMGVSGLVGWPYYRRAGTRAMVWMSCGVILYLVGGFCDAVKHPIIWPGVLGPHEVLHVCDVLATCCHIVFIVRYALSFSRSQSVSR
jgi:hemolysin III